MRAQFTAGDPLDQGVIDAHDRTFAGYHQFRNPEGEPYGSFEVFYAGEGELEQVVAAGPHEGCGEWAEPDSSFYPSGWYWWPCFPGCMPDGDGEPSGPFPTAEGAYLDAIGD